jgi:hypothetical protein
MSGSRVLAVLLVLLGQAACRRAEEAPRGRFEVPLVAAGADSDAVVATVDGRPIRASDVALQARTSGATARQALDALVDAEVLAGEAARKQLGRDPQAVEAARAAAVRSYLHHAFERERVPAAIPMRTVSAFYQKNLNHYDHPQLVHVWHILVKTRGVTPEKKAEAQRTAEEIARRAQKARSADQFKAIADPLTSPTEPFAIEEITTARDGWVERPFSEAAFQLKKPGDTTGVVETTYGYHVLYLVEYLPPIHRSLDETEGEIRAGLLPAFQRDQFPRWVDEQKRTHQIVVHPERLR